MNCGYLIGRLTTIRPHVQRDSYRERLPVSLIGYQNIASRCHGVF